MTNTETSAHDSEPSGGRRSLEAGLTRLAFGLGALLLIFGAAHWWLGERTFARMRSTTCSVLSKKIDANLLVSSRRRSTTSARYREEAHLVFAHSLNGRSYSFSEDFVYDWALYSDAGYEEGKSYPCRYDPENPGAGTIRGEFDSTDSQTFLAFGLVALLLGAIMPPILELARNAGMRGRS